MISNELMKKLLGWFESGLFHNGSCNILYLLVKSDTGESKTDDDSAPSEVSEKPRKKSVDELPIDSNHPEVVKMVTDAMTEAEKKEPELNTDDYIDVLEEAIQKRAEELVAEDPNGPR